MVTDAKTVEQDAQTVDSGKDVQKAADSADKVQKSSETTKTYTEKEFQAKFGKERSTYDTKINELTKTVDSYKTELGDLNTQLESNKSALKELQELIEKGEEDKYKDDPDQLDLYKQKKVLKSDRDALNNQITEFTRHKKEHQVEIELAKSTRFETDVWEIAAEYNADPVALKEDAENLGITDLEKIKIIAKRIGTKTKPKPSDTEETEEEFEPSSGKGGGGLSDDDFMLQYALGKVHDHKRAERIQKKLLEGG